MILYMYIFVYIKKVNADELSNVQNHDNYLKKINK